MPPPRIFHLRKPGAHHRARFMHIAIYVLKMQLMSERFKMSQEELNQLKKLSDYIVLFHSIAFLRSRLGIRKNYYRNNFRIFVFQQLIFISAACAPVVDLQLIF